MPFQRLEQTLAAIQPLDRAAMKAATTRQTRLTKPAGALGRLEALSIHLAGITGKLNPPLERKAVIVMAGDHGVTQQGVSAYPQEVTAQMVRIFLDGGAAINVLARQAGARVVVVDIGVASDLPDHPSLVQAKVARGTRDFTQTPAMTQREVEQAIAAGIEVLETEVRRGLDVVAIGEMGIGNTTAASALTAVFTHTSAEKVTGRGTGVDDEALARKVRVVQSALDFHHPDPADPIDVLAKVGGLEIAGLVGVLLGAAGHRLPVVIDGFISSSAALVAAAISPTAKDYFIASHRSVEQGHRVMLRYLSLRPLLDLNLRLGEGTGAVLAFPLIEAAVRTLNEMATFESAGISTALDDRGNTPSDL